MRALSIGLEKILYRWPYLRPEIVLACHLCRCCTPLIISVRTGMHALRNSSRKLYNDPGSQVLGEKGICLAGTVMIVGSCNCEPLQM